MITIRYQNSFLVTGWSLVESGSLAKVKFLTLFIKFELVYPQSQSSMSIVSLFSSRATGSNSSSSYSLIKSSSGAFIFLFCRCFQLKFLKNSCFFISFISFLPNLFVTSLYSSFPISDFMSIDRLLGNLNFPDLILLNMTSMFSSKKGGYPTTIS